MALFNAPGWLLKQKGSSSAAATGDGTSEDVFIKDHDSVVAMRMSVTFYKANLTFYIRTSFISQNAPSSLTKLNVYIKYKKKDGKYTGHIKTGLEMDIYPISREKTLKIEQKDVDKIIYEMLSKKTSEGGTSELYISFDSGKTVITDSDDPNPTIYSHIEPDFKCTIFEPN